MSSSRLQAANGTIVMLFSLPLGLSALRSSVLSQPVGQMKETMCLNVGGTHTGKFWHGIPF